MFLYISKKFFSIVYLLIVPDFVSVVAFFFFIYISKITVKFCCSVSFCVLICRLLDTR